MSGIQIVIYIKDPTMICHHGYGLELWPVFTLQPIRFLNSLSSYALNMA